MFQTLLRSMPLWLIGCLILTGCILASQLGRFIHRRFASEADRMKTGTEGYIVGALFALLAFMISATFSIAVDRFENKRAWIAREASSISMSYWRAGFLDEPGRAQLRSILRRYARSRAALENDANTGSSGALSRSKELQRDLSAATLNACYPLRSTPVAAYMI